MLMLYDVRAATPSRARHKYRYRPVSLHLTAHHMTERMDVRWRTNVWKYNVKRLRVGQQEHSVLCWANMDVVLM